MTVTEEGSPGEARALGPLNVVAPVLNEQQTIEAFSGRVVDALAGIPFELVMVDYGSTDRSPELYVGRIYDEVKRRPLYVVRGRRNTPDEADVRAETSEGVAAP